MFLCEDDTLTAIDKPGETSELAMGKNGKDITVGP